ncbi:MAG: tRNA preQ1(34) S-adenosylmethionine ribosyltransferase-isomerase QueA [Treponema sp.]|jgi:S-adenosylmethionine:tRNA ribosyltransferase-isomerase|nr:tRNA preQ1(34) S-adenosylmethionine ribosyltransferase-isomerase QueA [Treponema sp.]
MKVTDFSFDLPEDLIAQYPPPERGTSRLMVLDRAAKTREHRRVRDLPALLEPGSLLVFNNSRVRKARIYGISPESGLRTEFLLLMRQDERTWKTMVRRTKRRRSGSRYIFDGGLEGEITGAEGAFRFLSFDRPVGDDWLDRYGRIPLPPYIKREDTPEDGERYQTVYAAPPSSGGRAGTMGLGGADRSAAAPTAGLHFTRELLEDLQAAGMETAFITLHVGLGTFLPVRTENVEDHLMHGEFFSIDEKTALQVEKARAEKRKIVAVGTTSVRTLETAWEGGALRRGEGSTSIFIYPGYTFKAVDALFTNFHTPRSSLLMLVAAFAETGSGFRAKSPPVSGREFILDSYAEAVREGYRFFSYGDAMLIR